jgi:probable rRNA maturation factor
LEIDLTVQTDPEFAGNVDHEHLNEVVVSTASEEASAQTWTLGLLITNDENVRRLNAQYRGEDCVTDVLAFASGEDDDGFVSPPALPPHLGDIIISYPRAVAQAAQYGHGTAEELDRLVVHGVLHLLGYDDQTQEERRAMWARQEAVVRVFHPCQT